MVVKVKVTIKKFNGKSIQCQTKINKTKLLKEAIQFYIDECFMNYDRGKDELEDDIENLAKVKVLKQILKELK